MVLQEVKNSELIMTKDKNEEKNNKDFEELLNEYDYSYPKRGEVIEGEIEMIDEDSIILDVGLKRAAQVPEKLKILTKNYLGVYLLEMLSRFMSLINQLAMKRFLYRSTRR